MVTLADLKKIEEIKGVKRYIVLQPDGRPLLNNTENPEVMAAMIMNCGAMCKILKNRRFRYLVINQPSGEDFYIFQMGNYFLGILKTAASDTNELVDKVADYFQELATL